MIKVPQQYTLKRPIQTYRVGDDVFLMDCMPHHQHVSTRQTRRGLVNLSVYPDGSHVMAVFDGVFYGADYAESPRTIDERWAMTEQFLQAIATVVPE